MRLVSLHSLLMLTALGCGRPPENPTAGYELVHAELGVKHRWSFDPAPHFPPSSPSPIEVTAPRDRFLAVLGRWEVERDDSAPSAPHVMRQRRDDQRASRILVQHLGFGGVQATVKCRLNGDEGDASCGLIFAARAEDDYLVARIDAREIRLVRVTGAVETELARSRAEPLATARAWHEATVWARGGDVFVHLDGEVALSARTEADLGRIGLFARGDASFDDLVAVALDRPLE
jgi:hypothetical protein